MKVYVVLEPTYCGHGDLKIDCIFKTKEAAEEYIKLHPICCYKMEEWEVMEA